MKTSTYHTVVTLAIAVCGLYVARDILLPLALAALLGFLLMPLVCRLERFRTRRVPAVLLAVFAVATIGSLACYQAAEQVIELAARLPEYRQNIREKLGSASELVGPIRDRLRAATSVVTEAKEPLAADESPATDDAARQPSAVAAATERALEGNTSTLQLLRDWLIPVISPLATAAVVIIFTIFMLIEWEDLRNRFIVLCGVDRVPGTTEALEESAARVSRYLRMQLLINCLYGTALGATCWLAGLPNPLLWGVLAALLRFVPYAGAIVGAGLPILMAVAVADGWAVVLLLTLAVLVMEMIASNVLEPWLYGSSTGVSPSGILISAFFWTWLWGGVGLLLATPLTVVLTIMGRQVPPLRFVTTLFSDEPPLSPAARLYQRLLARDTYEVLHIVEEELREHRSQADIGDLLLEPLTQAVADEAHGVLSHDRLLGLVTTMGDVESDLSETLSAEDWKSIPSAIRSIVVAPARTEADAAAAHIMAAALTNAGWGTQALARTDLASDLSSQILASEAAPVLCGLGPRAVQHCRYLLRNLGSAGWDRPVLLLLPLDAKISLDSLATTMPIEQVSIARNAVEMIAKLASAQEPLSDRELRETQRQPAA